MKYHRPRGFVLHVTGTLELSPLLGDGPKILCGDKKTSVIFVKGVFKDPP